MRTLILLALLLPLAAAAQSTYDQYRLLGPNEVDPHETYIFQHAIVGAKLHDGRNVCIALFAVHDQSGEWVRIATSMDLCQGNFPKGTWMNFSARVVCNNDSIQ